MIQARDSLLRQVRRMSQTLRSEDKEKTGVVSRRIFARALTQEGGKGRLGEAELTRYEKELHSLRNELSYSSRIERVVNACD